MEAKMEAKFRFGNVPLIESVKLIKILKQTIPFLDDEEYTNVWNIIDKHQVRIDEHNKQEVTTIDPTKREIGVVYGTLNRMIVGKYCNKKNYDRYEYTKKNEDYWKLQDIFKLHKISDSLLNTRIIFSRLHPNIRFGRYNELQMATKNYINFTIIKEFEINNKQKLENYERCNNKNSA